MATYEEQELRRLLVLSEGDLYIDLYARSEMGQGVLGSPGMKQQRGRQLFDESRQKLQTLICDRWQGCEKTKSFDDVIKLVAAMAALIAPAAPQIPAATAAILIAKIGIDIFCECGKKEKA